MRCAINKKEKEKTIMKNESIKSTEMEKELFSIIKEWKKESKVKGVILVNHDCATNYSKNNWKLF